MVNVFSEVIQECNVSLYDASIVDLGPDYHGKEEVDLSDEWVVPGLIDRNLHIAISMLLPSRLAAALLPTGITTIISNPHEIGNAMGMGGIRFMLRISQAMPFDIFLRPFPAYPQRTLKQRVPD